MKEALVTFNTDNDGFPRKPKLIHFPYMCPLGVGTFSFLMVVTPFSGGITCAFGLLEKELVHCLRMLFSFRFSLHISPRKTHQSRTKL